MNRRSPGARLLLTGTLLLVASLLLASDWSTLPTPPPIGAGVYVLAVSPVDPAIIFAGGNTGLTRTTDGGSTWAPPELACAVTDIKFAASPNARVFAACSTGDVYRSDDGGTTWAISMAVEPAPGFNNVTTRLAISSSLPDTVFAAHSQEHHGLSLVSEESTISKSGDGGQSWEPVFSENLLVTDLAIAETTPETVFASVDLYGYIGDPGSGGLRQSTDGGLTWDSVSGLNHPTGPIAVSALDPTDVLIAEGALIYRSADSGHTWSLAKDVASNNVSALLFDPASSAAYAGTTGGGVYRSQDGGQTWQDFSDGLMDLNVSALAISAARLYAAGASGNVSAITPPCVPSATTLCIDSTPGDHRFQIQSTYQVQPIYQTLQDSGPHGSGHAISLEPVRVSHGGAFWFFSPDNPELLVKVLDGCGINQMEWFFASAATNVAFTINVVDTLTGESKSYSNPYGPAQPIQDTNFSSCTAALTEASAAETSAAPGESTSAREATSSPIIFTCTASATTLCIDGSPGDHRFKVEVEFQTSQGGGSSGNGHAIPLSPVGITHGGAFWFFSPDNPEMLVKVLDGCAINGQKWFFASAGTNVAYTMTLTDTATGQQKIYTNADLRAAEPILDTAAFAGCP